MPAVICVYYFIDTIVYYGTIPYVVKGKLASIFFIWLILFLYTLLTTRGSAKMIRQIFDDFKEFVYVHTVQYCQLFFLQKLLLVFKLC